MNEFWIIVTGFLVCTTCGLLGTFLVLRRMSMVGDAISHSVLPGIVLAYVLAQSRSPWPMFLGAAALGMVTTLLIDLLRKRSGLRSDVAIGLSFTFLFAVGVIMLTSLGGGNVDIDQECVLFGDLIMINMRKVIIDGDLFLGPEAFYFILPVFLLVVLACTFGFKGFQLISFSEDLALAQGVKVSRWNLALMALTSLTTVVSFESVGAILVVGFLVIPSVTANLLTDDLRKVLWLVPLHALLSSVLGYFVAVWWNTSISGSMVTVGGFWLLLALGYDKLRTRSARQKVMESPVGF